MAEKYWTAPGVAVTSASRCCFCHLSFSFLDLLKIFERPSIAFTSRAGFHPLSVQGTREHRNKEKDPPSVFLSLISNLFSISAFNTFMKTSEKKKETILYPQIKTVEENLPYPLGDKRQYR